ncbi:hypothetical protein ACERK3_00245 [Phycisphaerales bacterium AB-hyl4]|uniref:DUF3618 domain-containing protein n=1 Tax=Natronomicrosphaera hydrolytica TaxID=3242702 RepID=A0ABV4U0K1_9BACT
MSNQPGMTPPPPPDDVPPKAEPLLDEITAAKARLLAATEKVDLTKPTHKINDFLRDHPYVAAGAALGAGLVVARVSVLRKLVVTGGVWAAKRYLLKQMRGAGR